MSQTTQLNDLFVQGRKNLERSEAWGHIKEQFLRTNRAADVQTALAGIVEMVVVTAFQASLGSGLAKSSVLIAAAYFARGQMFPYAAADILIVLEANATASTDAVDEFLRLLWAGAFVPR